MRAGRLAKRGTLPLLLVWVMGLGVFGAGYALDDPGACSAPASWGREDRWR